MDKLLTAMADDLSFPEKCQKHLHERWKNILQLVESGDITEPLDEKYCAFKENIKHCLTCDTKSYRYVLPTQLLSKAVDHSLDCRSLQAAFASRGSFDAHTIAHKVIVPFDKENHNVLGGSNEPYVNNPLRCTAVSRANRARQKTRRIGTS